MVSKKSLLFLIFCIALSGSAIECMEIFDLVELGHLANAQRLVKKNDFDPNIENQEGEALVFILTAKGYTSLLGEVIDKPTFNPHVHNRKGESLLSVLSKKGYTAYTEKVIAHKNFSAKTFQPQQQDCEQYCLNACAKRYEEGYQAGYNNAQNKWMVKVQQFVEEAREDNGIKKRS